MKEMTEVELPRCEFAYIDQITHVNFRPHPFTIGTRHVAFASDKHGGMLDDFVCKQIPCAHPKCRLSYDEHESDNVAFVKLTRDCTNAEMHTWLKSLIGTDTMKGVDGFVFVETGYRVKE